MKGTIVVCLQEVVEGKGGKDSWVATLKAAGFDAGTTYMTQTVVPDEDVLTLIGAAAQVLGVPQQAAMDAFGEHWALTYAPKMYGVYYDKHTNARDFLLEMDRVHVTMTRTAGATPPRFTYEDRGPHELVMTYSSPRGLSALMPSLIKGVGTYYKQKVAVRRDGDTLTITFA